MLVLTRFQNESIYIGDDIIITTLEPYDNGLPSIGIEAPLATPIHIGDKITVMVIEEYANGMQRIGINAPKHIAICRDDAHVQKPKKKSD